ELLAVTRELVERVAGQEKAQALALGVQNLALRPLAQRRDDVLERGIGLVRAEQPALPDRVHLRGALGELERARNRGHQRRAVHAEAVERARPRERLEHPAPDLLLIDPAAEVEQARVRPVRVALRDDRLDRAPADALDRAEPVADPARACRSELE